MFNDAPESPGEALRRMLDERGWTQDELAAITGRPRPAISEIVSGRRGITAEMAVALAAAFKNTPSFWLKLESDFRLSRIVDNSIAVQQRATLYDLAPIREMQKRGWIRPTKDTIELEQSLCAFFGISAISESPSLSVAMRKTDRLDDLTAAQRTWCFRAKQLAKTLVVKPFDPAKLSTARVQLRRLAAYPKEATHIPQAMADCGIRFVIIEPLAGAKIDGAAFWLDEHSPVIAVSARYDRIDAFWFTVMHEFAHIENADAISVDDALVGDDAVQTLTKDAIERRADQSAASSLVPADELDSFVRRVSPLYSSQRIIQFAHRIKMHPGIIVGQLQHLGELGYAAHRDMLVKIRSVVTPVALTDGWGKTVSIEAA